VDYEPSDTDILYAEGITTSDGLASMEFSFRQANQDVFRNQEEQPDPALQLVFCFVCSIFYGV